MRDALCDEFLDAFTSPPSRITLDMDAFDDPAHGRQQLIFCHGFYEQYQYLPIAITRLFQQAVTCAETDMVALAGLRHGTCAASLGADDDLRYLARRIRERFPDVEIIVRADSAFGVPLMYQADSWGQLRQVVIKCAAHAQGTNRRAVSTNRPGWLVNPTAVYDEYAERGESQNRNKELKRELEADRLSDHRFLANFFRLYLRAAAATIRWAKASPALGANA